MCTLHKLHNMQRLTYSVYSEFSSIYPLLKRSLSLKNITLKALQVSPLHHLSFSGQFLLFL